MTANVKEIPINALELIPILDDMLISFLKKLSKDDWNRQTIAKKWKVKDVAAHLLDGNIRGISFGRDKHLLKPESEINSNTELINYLNNLNADWVVASRRISPELLIQFLDSTNKDYYKYIKTLDPFAKSIFPVSWAGETESKNSIHIAREYTEKWIHQQQIRDAFQNKEIMTSELFHPFISILMLGLPNAYKEVKAEENTIIKIEVTSSIGGIWFLQMKENQWSLTDNAERVNTEITIAPDTAWKLFTKSIRAENHQDFIQIKGYARLAAPALGMVSVMA